MQKDKTKAQRETNWNTRNLKNEFSFPGRRCPYLLDLDASYRASLHLSIAEHQPCVSMLLIFANQKPYNSTTSSSPFKDVGNELRYCKLNANIYLPTLMLLGFNKCRAIGAYTLVLY